MALPRPEPFLDPAGEQLLAWYQAVESRLHDRLVAAVRGGYSWSRIQVILKEINDLIGKLEAEAGVWDRYRAEQAYARGSKQAIELAIAQGRLRGQAATSGVPKEAILRIAQEFTGQRQTLLQSILRQSHDFLRELVSGELAVQLGVGTSEGELARAIRNGAIARLRGGRPLQHLASRLIKAVGVVYSDGTVHSLAAYGQMAARTGMGLAMNAASIDRYTDMGAPCIEVSAHRTLCPLCRPYEGVVFSINEYGDRLGYARMPVPLPIHPNCLHYPIPYQPDLQGVGRQPDELALYGTAQEKYRAMRESDPAALRFSRQGFRSWAEVERAQAKNPSVSDKDLRGPSYHYPGIEGRRQQAVVRMLREPGLTYAEAMRGETAAFRGSKAYEALRPSVLPAAQQANNRVPPTRVEVVRATLRRQDEEPPMAAMARPPVGTASKPTWPGDSGKAPVPAPQPLEPRPGEEPLVYRPGHIPPPRQTIAQPDFPHVKAAEAWVKERFGVEADLGLETDYESAVEVVTTVRAMAERFPAIFDNERLASVLASDALPIESTARTVYGTQGDPHRIELNAHDLAERAQFLEHTNRSVETGFLAKGSQGWQGTVVHEFGHVVRRYVFETASASTEDNFALADRILQWQERFPFERSTVSLYGQSSVAEQFAENFTAMFSSRPEDWSLETRTFVAWLGDLLAAMT